MAVDVPMKSGSSLWGWATRLIRGATPPPDPERRDRDGGPAQRPATPREAAAAGEAPRGIQDVVRRLVADDRYAFVLLKEAADDIEVAQSWPAWEALGQQMALVPGGVVPVVRPDGGAEPVAVAAFYLDRCSVTNEQYARFIRAGGYDDLEIWPREVWASLMRFVDRTGKPGPRDWRDGAYPPAKADHPVVGVCWYEALAYARWVGKRLPVAAEWQKAAGWPEQHNGNACRRYPWGEIFAAGKANLWSTGVGTTVPVREFRAGSTPNGLHQMTGNVWEWLADPLETIPGAEDEVLRSDKPLRRVIGGAFDTYLTAEASNYFVTGQPEIHRRPNIGFRCAVPVDRLRPAP
jgi:gamma-glutamyl hercynylcysteine S-oxide synthase